MNKQEFDRFKGLLNGEQVHQLSSKVVIDALRTQSVNRLLETQANHLYLVHDPCDIRKPHSEKLEDLGTVRSLDGELIKGYRSMNTIAIEPEQLKVHLIDHVVYSNGSDNYVKRSELESYQTDQWHKVPAKVLKRINNEDYVNTYKLFTDQARRCSEQLKSDHPDLKLTHIQDREFDGEEYFKFIDQQLGDYFITRVRKSRNSNESKPILTKQGKPSKKRLYDKLISKSFTHSWKYQLNKVRFKKRIYQQANCLIEWEPFVLNGHRIYTVIRVQFTDRKGRSIFKQPMLLITNHVVKEEKLALSIYKNYLLRSKIEALFKFLKEELGWEKIRVRDFQSIQNLLALGFYIGGYFYDIEQITAQDELYQQIAKLGGGKGKFTKFYLVKGLARLCQYRQMVEMLKGIPPDQRQKILELANFDAAP